ncbi:uncharacterized protein LOC143019154 [Oratosquilla oratoria]|uniref:uncharacterized protein LOC143019154 n=1 Tax=Oratosquilla oratoria TaxID=337810 RepID=UPI003F760C60
MLYGREPVLPIDVDHEFADCTSDPDDPNDPEVDESDFQATLSNLQMLQDVVFKQAYANLERAQTKQQADFARRRYKQNHYIVGDKVLWYNLRRADRKGGKQTDPWDGPYEVAQVCEKVLYYLINVSTNIPLKNKVNGCNLKPFLERPPEVLPPSSSSDPPSPTSLSEPPSPIVQIIGVQQQEIIYKFNPITVATQRAICNNSGGRLIFKKKFGPSGKIYKTFKNTSEPLAVKVIKGDGFFFRSMTFAITGEEDQHPVVRSLICDFLSTSENIQVDSMREDKVWGITTEIIAASNMFQVNVCVWAKFGSIHTWHIHRPKGSKILKDSVYLENNVQ